MATTYFSLGGEESTQRFFSKSKFPLSFPGLPTIIPHRLRRKFRSTKSRIRARQSPTATVTHLQTSLNPQETIRSLRTHQWSAWDAQYIFLAILGIFSLSVIQSPGPFIKTLIASALLLSLLVPLTRQFTLPFLPIAGWLVFFYACKFISGDYRPPIWVRVLPALENILYGANLSNILSAHKSTFFDVVAWIPYGLTHFGAPFVCSGLMFLFGPPGLTPTFARAFGYMNITGVTIQLLFPCSPPWYENKYGLAPADYSMPGSPAGLAAIDKLLGVDLYTSNFTASPVVFGAFPSLHSGCATIEVLFMSYCFPKLRPLFTLYLLWLWWSTMYLSHHYAVDLVAGSIISAVAYFIAKSQFLPRMQAGKMFRWDYEYVEYGEAKDMYSYASTGIELDEENYPVIGGDSDEWTLASSSGRSNSSRSPSAGMRSPVLGDDGWEGETLASDGESFMGKS